MSVTNGGISRAAYHMYGSYDATNGLGPGGLITPAIASGTLLVGDVVYWSALNTVAKHSAADELVAGVVVGGDLTNGLPCIASADVGAAAGTATTGFVLVLQKGRAYVTNDAGGALTAGQAIKASVTTAGNVVGAVVLTATSALAAGGTTVTSTSANPTPTTTLAGEGSTKIIGKAVAAISASAVGLAYINII